MIKLGSLGLERSFYPKSPEWIYKGVRIVYYNGFYHINSFSENGSLHTTLSKAKQWIKNNPKQ